MSVTIEMLQKWEKELRVLGHPMRFAIFLAIGASDILEEMKHKQEMLRTMLSSPKGFIQYYYGMLKLAPPLLKRGKLVELRYLLIEWPIKFCIYLALGKGILLPFQIKD